MYSLLVVDDDANERKGLQYLVSNFHLPFVVTEASNGKDALSKFESYHFDCLITDIKMPVMNGLTLCEEIQTKCLETVKIIYSAYSDFEFAQKAIKAKVDDYILKPIIPDEFCRVMREIVAKLGSADKPQDGFKQYVRQEDTALDSGTQKHIIREIIRYIDDNLQNDIGLNDIASHVYLSPGYLSTLFKRETKKSVIQYITIRRMQKAKEMMLSSNLSIKKIGQTVGYQNTSYFCLLFRKYFGITAQQMREAESDGNMQNMV